MSLRSMRRRVERSLLGAKPSRFLPAAEAMVAKLTRAQLFRLEGVSVFDRDTDEPALRRKRAQNIAFAQAAMLVTDSDTPEEALSKIEAWKHGADRAAELEQDLGRK